MIVLAKNRPIITTAAKSLTTFIAVWKKGLIARKSLLISANEVKAARCETGGILIFLLIMSLFLFVSMTQAASPGLLDKVAILNNLEPALESLTNFPNATYPGTARD
jgi:hypothetical protein